MNDGSRIRVCAASEVPQRHPLRVVVEQLGALAVCRVGSRFHAVEDLCSHGMALLSEGELDGGKIVCPFHGGSFDLATGLPIDKPCVIPVKAYTLVEFDGQLQAVVGAGP